VLLPEGITGFLPGPDKSRKSVDLRDVATLAHLAARLSGGRVVAKAAAGTTPNFHSARINTGGQVSWIVVNEFYPLVAAASSISMGGMDFIDGSEHLKHAVALTSPFRLLPEVDLSRPAIEHDVSNLPLLEQEQIRYWQPERVGDMIFNYWD
jgi:hypothetical protein